MDDERLERFRKALQEATEAALDAAFDNHGEASFTPSGEQEHTYDWTGGTCLVTVTGPDDSEYELFFGISVTLDEVEEIE